MKAGPSFSKTSGLSRSLDSTRSKIAEKVPISKHPLAGLSPDNVVRLIDEIGLATPKDQLILWSGLGRGNAGVRLSQEYAAAHGGLTLEMTSGGKWLNEMDLFGRNSPFMQEEALEIWGKVSTKMIQQDNQANLQNNSTIISPGELVSVLKDIGITLQTTGKIVEVTESEEVALNSVSTMKKVGLVNPDISQSYINIHQITLAGVIELYFTTVLVEFIYKNSAADELHFNGYLSAPDDYGNNQINMLFSFDFNRITYNQINWENFSAKNMITVAPNFQFTQWYLNKAASE